MAVRPKTRSGLAAPAEPVPVAMLGRTSTLELQDPYGSITRQITSAREWLPTGSTWPGITGTSSPAAWTSKNAAGRAIISRSWTRASPATGAWPTCWPKPAPRPPVRRRSLRRHRAQSGRDTFNALKLERELGDSGILLFAADEPVDLDGTDPATILLRRTKQNIAEYFRLSLKQKMWRGLRTHAAQGYNLGKVLDGYLPEKIPHPAPSKASQGRTKTLLVLDEQRAPIIAAIYAMRAEEKLGVPAIHARLAADPVTYPPADPATGWTLGGLYSILANPKYTGYQVFGRTRRGKPVPHGQWYWLDQRTHPAIVDREVWETAQKAGAEHRSSRDGAIHNPANWRSYPFRSRIRCKICKRRMCGLTKVHAANKTPPSTCTTCASTTRTPPATWPPPPATPHRPGPGRLHAKTRCSAGYRPTPWRPAGNSASPSSSRTPPPPGKPSTTPGRRPGQTAQAADRPARQPDARTQTTPSTWPTKPARLPPPHPHRLRDPARRTQGHRDAAHRTGRRRHPRPRPGPGQPAARSHRRPRRPAVRPASRTLRRL